MNFLSIDTSTKELSLAVSRDEKVVKFRNIALKRPLSSSIMPGIKKILEDARIPLARIDGFAVGLGPGSFTSLRVGVSTVKGLAFASGKPVVGISSLDVLAMGIPEDHAQICVLCDAKRNLVYACIYDKRQGILRRKTEYLLISIQDLLKKIKGNVLFAGDGIELFKEEILKAPGIRPEFSGQDSYSPSAKALASLALMRFRERKQDDISRLVPLYLYPDHCQIKPKEGNAGK
jgi:tRNA threonylcarbamoyladenosine biosynthesis protein TsaB